MNWKRLMVFIIAFSTFIKNVYGGNPGDEIRQTITDFMAAWNIPGAAVSITKDGKSVFAGGFGFSDLNKTQPVTRNSLFRIASVSKPVTSVAIMKLVEQGKLSLSDTVFGKDKILKEKFYMEVINDPRIYSITVQNLLEHTAGWNRDIPCDGYDHSDAPFFPVHVALSEKAPMPAGDSTFIRFLLRKGLNTNPGKQFSYSNVGYLILGKVIEKISGESYESYVQQYILQPAGIHGMHLGKNLPENKFNGEVEYYGSGTTTSSYGNGAIVPWQYGGFNLEAMNAHGGWIASAEDLTRLMLATDGKNTHQDVLNTASVKMMTTRSGPNPNYAKGWAVNSLGNSWHTGSMEGTSAFVCRTANGYTWAFLFNSRSDNSRAFWKAFDRLPWQCIAQLDAAS